MLYNLGYALTGPKSALAGGSSPSYLAGVIPSACCDLDATIADSYGGTGQIWTNLIASPADGAGQGDYDFYRGEDANTGVDEPAFTGTAGDSGAYWALDGGDSFNIGNFTAATTLYNAHKTGASAVTNWWIACAFASPAGGRKGLWGSSWLSDDYGIYPWMDESACSVYRGASSVNVAGWSYTANAPQLAIFSMDTTNNNMRIWLNDRTALEVSPNFGDMGLDANRSFRIGAGSTSSGAIGQMLGGSKIYAFSCGNEYIDDTKAGLLFDEYNTRHGRTYA